MKLPLNKSQSPLLHGFIAVLLGLFFILSAVASKDTRHFEVDVVNSILAYPERPALKLRDAVKYGSNWLLERKGLKARVTALELRNRELVEALQRENIPLSPAGLSYVSARVTLRYPDAWWQEIRVDKGAKDCVERGAAVTSEGYLVGRVSRVGNDFAWVELITSSTFLTAATIDETRDLGVVNGDDRGNLTLLYIPEERKPKKDMKISTSLMSEHIPPGIPIGLTMDEKPAKEGFTPIAIQSGAHLTQLYSVEIFTDGASE